MKKSISLLEIIIVIALLSLLYLIFLPNNKINKLDEITNRLSLYLSYVRYKALIDDKYSDENNLWHKKRWTIKFFRCRESEGGIYFSIYNDKNLTGHPSVDDSLKDPLTNKNIYSSNFCQENTNNSKYTLLTKSFDIVDVNISCNETTSLGQLSFGANGKIFSKLSNHENEFNQYEIKERCKIILRTKEEEKKEIEIYPKSGFREVINNN
ncbi:type II secretion system protein [Arcobacter aquimarinus]|uniref:Prepilin-type cleavage/methylation domain-containing protein n=1 Tax=Arcobacter aquimarinus TaxID=1315211 RepID=A0AAE7B3L0_9BACT|nr:type II secretion system protein [Arcobacter aquimarinus]QKE26883.1 hypothetical protein AAQM_2182 [Arcobacter aquimarinus]RXI36114.1 hypothetical protein CP986_04155 [Arcobacter aquimarinus]